MSGALDILYPTMAEAAPMVDAPGAAPDADEAWLRATYPSMYQPAPTVMYPSMVEHVEPFVDPGDSPEACRAVVLDMLRNGGSDGLLEVFGEDPAKAAAYLERIGLADNLQLRDMLRGLNMYPSVRLAR